MPVTNCKTIIHKLLVLGKNSSFHNFITAIKVIIKERVTNILHVYSYLVSTAGFKPAFNKCYIIKSLQHCIMRNSLFSMLALWISGKQFPETLVPSYMSCNCTFFIFKISPYQCYIPSVNRMIKELFSQVGHSFGGLCKH